MRINNIYCCDVLDGLSQLEDESIDLIITSPPYNKIGLNGKRNHGQGWGEVIYNGDIDADNMPEDKYQEWQIQVLKECYRVLKKDGSMFYNHKNRIVVGKGEILSPYVWLLKTPFLIRQEIIWDRGSGLNVNKCRYTPSHENIYWLTKSKKPRFSRQNKQEYDVWHLDFDRHNSHPAPFPITIPDKIIPNVSRNERITVLDPFSGSGTVAKSAIAHNCNYLGFEKYECYARPSQIICEMLFKDKNLDNAKKLSICSN